MLCGVMVDRRDKGLLITTGVFTALFGEMDMDW